MHKALFIVLIIREAPALFAWGCYHCVDCWLNIYIYSIGQQGKTYIKAFDLRLEAVQHNIYYITIYNISAQIQLRDNYNIGYAKFI